MDKKQAVYYLLQRKSDRFAICSDISLSKCIIKGRKIKGTIYYSADIPNTPALQAMPPVSTNNLG